MPSIDETIESAVVSMILTAIPSSLAEGRKKPGMREGDGTPKILVACSYDGEEAGHANTGNERQVFYKLYVFFMSAKNVLGSTGDETINAWRQTVSKLLAQPFALIALVSVVDDIFSTTVPEAALPDADSEQDIQALGFDVETYEGLT